MELEIVSAEKLACLLRAVLERDLYNTTKKTNVAVVTS